MSKHRYERPRRARPIAFLTTAAVALSGAVMVFAFWPPETTATAASRTIVPPQVEAEVDEAVRGVRRLVVFGHSMPTGGGASDDSLGYAQVAARTLDLPLLNLAEGGTLATTAANAMDLAPRAGRRDVVVIHTGMNDIFRRGDDAAPRGRAAVQRLLAGTARARQRVVVLECQPPDWEQTPPQLDRQDAYEAWNTMLREEAAAAGDVDVLDTCAVWDPESFTDAPKYHPNDAGHAEIAEQLVALIESADTPMVPSTSRAVLLSE